MADAPQWSGPVPLAPSLLQIKLRFVLKHLCQRPGMFRSTGTVVPRVQTAPLHSGRAFCQDARVQGGEVVERANVFDEAATKTWNKRTASLGVVGQVVSSSGWLGWPFVPH